MKAVWAPLVVLLLLGTGATPAVAQTVDPPLPLDVDLLQRQAQVGLMISETLWAESSNERFVAFVNEHAVGLVDWRNDGLVHASFAENGQQVNIAFVDLQQSGGVVVSPRGHRGVVGSFASSVAGQVAINGNWFEPWDGPAISNGELYGGADHDYTALFGVTADKKVIVEHHLAVNQFVDPRIHNGVSGHPTLIDDGVAVPIYPDPTFSVPHPRTVIAEASSRGILILVTVDGRQPGALGMTGDETASLMVRLGAQDAVMLDGGGSTTMWIAGKGIVNSPPGPARAVANEVVVL